MIDPYQAAEWGFNVLLALGLSVIALRVFKMAPVWALVIGMVVFTGFQFPFRTHAVLLEIPRPKTN
ncbi:MAG TPA: hypothetical protein VN154_05615 [Rhizomicrobium sp.]|nr:hypothetical protein [Rhizomicrobium sp.]